MKALLAIIAVIFIAVPDISAIDLLPDALGFFLLYTALAVPSEFSNKLADARTLLFKLMLLSAADFAVSSVITSDDLTMVLLIAFCFGIAEAVMMYIVFDGIIDGMVYLGTNFPAVGVYMPERERVLIRYRTRIEKRLRVVASREAEKGRIISEEDIKSKTDELTAKRSDKSLSRFIKRTHRFIVLRAALNILPEFTALSAYEYEGDVGSYNVNIADFRGLFVTLAVFVSAVIAVFWAASAIRYVNGIRRDKPFITSIYKAYNSGVKTNFGLLQYKLHKAALVVLAVGIVLSLDFVIDHINIIPDFISAAAFVIFWLMFIRKRTKTDVAGFAVSIAYAVFAAIQWIAVKSFIVRFDDFTRTMKSDEAFKAHIMLCILTFIAEVLFVCVMYFIYKKLKGIIFDHTGFLTKEGESDAYSVKLHERLSRANVRIFIFSVITAVASVAYMILVGINKGVEAMEDNIKYVFYVPVFESIATVVLIINTIYIIFAVKHVSDVSDGLDERYKLD